MSDYFIGSLLFLIGCLILTVDAWRKDPRDYVSFVGMLFFDIGCVYYIKDSTDDFTSL